MNVSDTAILLTYAALGDNRTVTRETAAFWAEVLRPDISLDEARSAVSAHFANSTEYLTPAHVNAEVTRQREVRKRLVPDVIPPRELADHPERGWQWTKVWQDAVIAGHTEDQARAIANHRFEIDEDLTPLAIESSEQVARVESLAQIIASSKPAPRKRGPVMRVPALWAADDGIQILDPDGWRDAGIDFRAPCTQEVYRELVATSTTGPFERRTEAIPTPTLARHQSGNDDESTTTEEKA